MLFGKILLKFYGYLAFHNYGNQIFNSFEKNLVLEQNSKFIELKLDRIKGLVKLNKILKEHYGTEYNEKNGMWSEHLILFASIAESDYVINNILEIGTFNGETAQILSALFPKSSILTIDLPFTQILETQMYKYETKNSKLIFKRNSNLNELSNVQFLEINSISLIENNKKFDLIWIDGDHSYPTAVIDIANAARLLSIDGIGICDDVYMKAREGKLDGRSTASIETLKGLDKAGLIKYNLLHKRIGGFFNFPSANKKYLGVFTKIQC